MQWLGVTSAKLAPMCVLGLAMNTHSDLLAPLCV